jgi:hypothetical protein
MTDDETTKRAGHAPVFCTACLLRIWKPEDGGPLVDSYFGEMHVNCASSIEARAAATQARTPANIRPILTKR